MDFYDAAEYHDIPSGAHACVYADGEFFCPPAQTTRFKATRYITVLGGDAAARYAGIADCEPGNAVWDPYMLAAWVDGRKAMGKLARVYTDLENLPRAHEAVGKEPNVRWWIASWGGKRTAAELAAAAGGLIKAETVWAQQYQGDTTGGFDVSTLLGTW